LLRLRHLKRRLQQQMDKQGADASAGGAVE